MLRLDKKIFQKRWLPDRPVWYWLRVAAAVPLRVGMWLAVTLFGWFAWRNGHKKGPTLKHYPIQAEALIEVLTGIAADHVDSEEPGANSGS